MEDRTARSSAPTEFEEKTATESRQKSTWLPNWRSFLVLLPGLCTLVLWEIAAGQWPSVARLVSQPVEIARGIVEVVATGTIWPHFDATLKEMAAGYVIGGHHRRHPRLSVRTHKTPRRYSESIHHAL
jgi:hypothetical protein